MDSPTAGQLPENSDSMLCFTIQKAIANSSLRVGRLAIHGRRPISTPNYAAITSRGAVPHLSPDNVIKHTAISSLYFGIEDFMEKQEPQSTPVYSYHGSASIEKSALRGFTGHSAESMVILGTKRVPPVISPQSNSNSQLAICTSVGFKFLDVDTYLEAGAILAPDILLAPADIVTQHKPSRKRAEKMADRTAAWVRDAVAAKEDSAARGQDYALFAAILPVEHELQSLYLRDLVDDFRGQISGLYMHNEQSLLHVPESLESLPRLGILQPQSPAEMLHQISLGVDLFIMPFVNTATDNGVALTFTFPPPVRTDAPVARQPLGINMWDTSHATDLSPLVDKCSCYACQKHHRAYLQHLLSAKEMLAWVLLQIHNHHVVDTFFAAIRDSIARATFDVARSTFDKYYEPELPASSGTGPRIRGYQIKSDAGRAGNKNAKAFNKFNTMTEVLAEAELPCPTADAAEPEDDGLGKAV